MRTSDLTWLLRHRLFFRSDALNLARRPIVTVPHRKMQMTQDELMASVRNPEGGAAFRESWVDLAVRQHQIFLGQTGGSLLGCFFRMQYRTRNRAKYRTIRAFAIETTGLYRYIFQLRGFDCRFPAFIFYDLGVGPALRSIKGIFPDKAVESRRNKDVEYTR